MVVQNFCMTLIICTELGGDFIKNLSGDLSDSSEFSGDFNNIKFQVTLPYHEKITVFFKFFGAFRNLI